MDWELNRKNLAIYKNIQIHLIYKIYIFTKYKIKKKVISLCAFWKSVLRWRWRSCPCKNKCTVVHSYLWEISGHLYERRGSTHRGQRSNGSQTHSLYWARPEDSRALHLFFLFCSELSFFLFPVHSLFPY